MHPPDAVFFCKMWIGRITFEQTIEQVGRPGDLGIVQQREDFMQLTSQAHERAVVGLAQGANGGRVRAEGLPQHNTGGLTIEFAAAYRIHDKTVDQGKSNAKSGIFVTV